jgi:tight adherence protein B
MNGWIIPALAFAGAALAVGGILYALAAGQRRVGRRLDTIRRDGAAEPSGRPGERADHFPTLTAMLERVGRRSAIETWIARAGLNWRPGEFAAAWLVLAAGLALGGWLLLGPLGAAGGIVIGAAVPFIALKALEARRLARFEYGLPDALMLIASSLRSGYGILRAMQAVRDEMGPPISLEFARTLDEANVGVPLPEALVHLVQRVPLPDLEIVVTAILIQLEVGGNLAEVMEIVAATVRERQRLRAEVNALTAEGRLSGVVLFVIPLGMAAILTVLNPSYMSALFKTTLGHLLIGCALVLQVLGGLVIVRMLRLDF